MKRFYCSRPPRESGWSSGRLQGQRLHQDCLLKAGAHLLLLTNPNKRQSESLQPSSSFYQFIFWDSVISYIYIEMMFRGTTNDQQMLIISPEQKDKDIWLSVLHLSWFTPVSILLKIDMLQEVTTHILQQNKETQNWNNTRGTTQGPGMEQPEPWPEQTSLGGPENVPI